MQPLSYDYRLIYSSLAERAGPPSFGHRSHGVARSAVGAAEHETQDAAESLWDVDDVAQYLKVSRSMVYKLGQTGELPILRVGTCLRFDPAVVRAFARGEVRGTPGGGVVYLDPRPGAVLGSPAPYKG